MRSRALLIVVCAFAFAASAYAQEVGTQDNEKEKDKEKKEKKEKPEDWGFRWDNRPSLRLGKGTRVDFRVRLQGDIEDSEAPLTDDEETSTVDIARRRIGIDGEILNLFDYQVERELGVDHDPWRDVYLNYKQFSHVQIQGGQFKLPFSLDENTSPTNLDFVFRSRAADLLAPGRDPGLMVHGRVLERGILRYEFGLFRNDGRGARTNSLDRVHGDRTVAGRATVQPFRSLDSIFRDLAAGVAFTQSDVPEGFPDLRGRTALDERFYRPDLWVNGTRHRFGLELRWRPGPFSVKSEYIRLTDQRLGESVEDTDLSPFLATGWYVSGTWAITGEEKAAGLDEPRRPLLQGGYGAVEVAARVERIRFGSVATDGIPSTSPRADVLLGNSDQVTTLGVNWYLNRWVKIQFNLIREAIDDPSQGPLPLQPTFWSRVIRFQFSM